MIICVVFEREREKGREMALILENLHATSSWLVNVDLMCRHLSNTKRRTTVFFSETILLTRVVSITILTITTIHPQLSQRDLV